MSIDDTVLSEADVEVLRNVMPGTRFAGAICMYRNVGIEELHAYLLIRTFENMERKYQFIEPQEDEEEDTEEKPSPDDLDGDGIANEDDDDIDGDGILNEDDDDVDGDGIPNDEDEDDYGLEADEDGADDGDCGCRVGQGMTGSASLLELLSRLQ